MNSRHTNACSPKPPAFIRARMNAGKHLAEIKVAGLPDEWGAWGSGFISTKRWIEIVHRSLTNTGKVE